MTSSLFMTGFASLLAISSALQFQVIHPFSDSACKNPVGVKAVHDSDAVTEIALGYGVGAEARGRKYEKYGKVDFENATAPDNGIGNWVRCNWMWMAPDAMQAPGKVILTAAQEGCVFTQLPVSATLWATFCCGGQCNHFTGSAPDPRPAGEKPHKREEITTNCKRPQKKNIPATTDMVAAKMGSLAARAALQKRDRCDIHDKECADKFWKGCKIDPETPTLAAGFQVAVSQIQSAAAGPGAGDSTITASIAFTVGTSTSFTQGSSSSSTQGLEVSVEGGVSFPVEAKTTVSASLIFTEEINQSTSHEQNESKQETVIQTLAQVLGTTGFQSYTPYYNCYMPYIDCGMEKGTGKVNVCYPAYDNKGQIRGEFAIVTVS
ncbi:hypothetical protein HYALB_00011133 [Hymenoscyphus albidus]|uniref:Uncharacterized protein n=1 Tax=Hymenoscyphus albidus TaxID=595503 RepID=A0A9N9Q688_9HELO|nr:hypothetical protein HYALB_00011133 [Hymenoscyphus albidus]